jgi:hypothetical protein
MERPLKQGVIVEIIGPTTTGASALVFKDNAVAHISAEGMSILYETAAAQGIPSPVGLHITYTTDKCSIIMVDFAPALDDLTILEIDRAVHYLGMTRVQPRVYQLIRYVAGVRAALGAKDRSRALTLINAHNKLVRQLRCAADKSCEVNQSS